MTTRVARALLPVLLLSSDGVCPLQGKQQRECHSFGY